MTSDTSVRSAQRVVEGAAALAGDVMAAPASARIAAATPAAPLGQAPPVEVGKEGPSIIDVAVDYSHSPDIGARLHAGVLR